MAYVYNDPTQPNQRIASAAGLDVALRQMNKQLRVLSVVHNPLSGYIIIVEDKSDG